MHFNVKNVLQLDEALHELPIHDSGITSIENEVGNKELLIHLSNLYENKNIVPFGYTYNTYVTEKDFANANAAQKEQTMTQNAVISDSNDIASASLKKSSITDNLVTHDVYTSRTDKCDCYAAETSTTRGRRTRTSYHLE